MPDRVRVVIQDIGCMFLFNCTAAGLIEHAHAIMRDQILAGRLILVGSLEFQRVNCAHDRDRRIVNVGLCRIWITDQCLRSSYCFFHCGPAVFGIQILIQAVDLFDFLHQTICIQFVRDIDLPCCSMLAILSCCSQRSSSYASALNEISVVITHRNFCHSSNFIIVAGDVIERVRCVRRCDRCEYFTEVTDRQRAYACFIKGNASCRNSCILFDLDLKQRKHTVIFRSS